MKERVAPDNGVRFGLTDVMKAAITFKDFYFDSPTRSGRARQPNATGPITGGIARSNQGWGSGDKLLQSCGAITKTVTEPMEMINGLMKAGHGAEVVVLACPYDGLEVTEEAAGTGKSQAIEQSLPRSLCHLSSARCLQVGGILVRILANWWSCCLGSMRIIPTELMVQPRIFLHVDHTVLPLRSFLTEIGTVRGMGLLETKGWKALSMANMSTQQM